MRAAFRSENIGTAELNHVVLQVQGYDLNCEEESESEGYPGLIKGRAMGGALDGKPISVSLRKTLTNQNVLKVADLTDQHHLSHTPIGGYVALEGVRLARGQMTARWLNRMGGPESVIRSGMPIQIAPVYGRDSQLRRYKVNGATIYNAQIIHMSDCQVSFSCDDLRSSLTEALQTRGAALFVHPPSKTMKRSTEWVPIGWHQGQRISVEKAVDDFLDRQNVAKLEVNFAEGAKVDILPLEIVRLNARVCESIDAGATHGVPINQYMTGGLGRQMEICLQQSGADISQRLENAFLAQAHPHAKEAFASLGWNGVWNRDILGFFAMRNIKLPSVTKFGFAVSTACLQSYSTEDLNLTKSRPFSDALPRNSVPTVSDPHSDSRFISAIYDAVHQLTESLVHRPDIKRQFDHSEMTNESSSLVVNGVSRHSKFRDEVPRSTLSAGEGNGLAFRDYVQMNF